MHAAVMIPIVREVIARGPSGLGGPRATPRPCNQSVPDDPLFPDDHGLSVLLDRTLAGGSRADQGSPSARARRDRVSAHAASTSAGPGVRVAAISRIRS